MRFARQRYGFAVTLFLSAGCAFHSTATHWHGHVGPDGQPVFVQQSTYVGCHLGILFPLFGSTTIDNMVSDATARIDRRDGTHLRLVETETNNFWYGVPPLSLFVTPVVASISIEYRPSRQALARAGVVDVESAGNPETRERRDDVAAVPAK
ncbi:MAG: hypothetical protein AB8H80_00645 [Planctomycetota bacterium]